MSDILADKLTGGHLLTKNAIWSFLGQAVPMVFALFTIPIMIKGLGIERFGLLTLVWIIIGYTSLFDLGIGRALTHFISKKLGMNDYKDLATIIWTSSILIMIPGIIGALILVLSNNFLITEGLKVKPIYINEVRNSIYLLSLSLPVLLLSSAFKGVLESYQQFLISSNIRVFIGICNYVGPLIVLPFSHDLSLVILTLCIGRIIACVLYLIYCSKIVSNLFNCKLFSKDYVKPLLTFGSWLTVSNIISPIMTYFDRFFIAGMLSSSVVAYYTTPYEMISRLWIIQGSITSVIFPALSSKYKVDMERARFLYDQSLKYIFILMFFPVVIIVLFAKLGLSLWLGAEFANHSYKIAQVLAIVTFIIGINSAPWNLIQATGKSDITAKIQMLELPVYLFSLWFFILKYGLIGAAIAILIRNIIDGILLHYFAQKLLRKPVNA